MNQYAPLYKQIALLTLLGVTWCAAASTGFAQGVLAQPEASAAPANTLTLAAANAGVHQCLPALSALAAIGIRNSHNSDVLFDWDRHRPDNAPVFSLLGIEYAQNNAAMSVTAVPASNGSCSVAAERIAFEPHVCRQIAQRELQGYQMTQLLPHVAVYTRAQEPGSSVSLIDAPPGCLTIRRFVRFSTMVTEPGFGGTAR